MAADRLDLTLIAEQTELDELVAEVAKEPAYGIDTEFHRERSYFAQLALVQLAWRGGVAVIDPFEVDVTSLGELLGGPGTAVAHASEQDLELLERICGKLPRALFDTQLASGFVGMASPSLKSLVHELLGRRLAKGDRLTDWTRRPLTRAQLDYAASDVAYLLALREELTERLSEEGRLDWALEECELMRARRRPPQAPEEAWWRMKEARQLRGRARGVAQEVAAWRERTAMARDRLPRYVLPDLALSAIAHNPPSTRGELGQVRGLDGRHLSNGAAQQILRAVRAGEELSEAEIHLPRPARQDRALGAPVSLAAAWVSHRAKELRIDAPLLGTRTDIQALFRGDPDARLATGWRYRLVGAPLEQLAAGEAALAVEGDGLVLEPRPAARPARALEH